jgi:hypothetical protein
MAHDLRNPDDALVTHLAASAGLAPGTARRLIDDVLAFHAETLEEYVVRRHAELAGGGSKNPDIFSRIQAEVAARPFRVGPCTLRQIRRIVYG